MPKTVRRRWDLLTFSSVKVDRTSVRRQYGAYRAEAGLPVRCDNPTCRFHSDPLVWNGAALPPILDHINGVQQDNRPKNLRYLCPNCDAQLSTRGGANKGRVLDVHEGGYVVLMSRRDGRLAYTLIADAGRIGLAGHAPGVVVAPVRKGDPA